jgi:hypothetical protein
LVPLFVTFPSRGRTHWYDLVFMICGLAVVYPDYVLDQLA